MPLTQDAQTAEKRGCTITRQEPDSFATNVAGRAFTDMEYALFVNPWTYEELKRLYLTGTSHYRTTSPLPSLMLPYYGCSVVELARLGQRTCVSDGRSLSGASFSPCTVDEYSFTGRDERLTRLINPSTSTPKSPKRKSSIGLTGNQTQPNLSAFARTFSPLFASQGLESSVAQSLELSCLATKRCNSEDILELTSGSTQTTQEGAEARRFAKSFSGSAPCG